MLSVFKKLAITLFILGIITGCSSHKEISNEDFSGMVQEVYDIDDTKSKEVYKFTDDMTKDVKVRSYESMIDTMHKMANTLIIADEIVGEIKITDERVNALIIEVMASDYVNKNTLLQILNRWKEGDFSKADKDHNYLWNKLGGTVGYATGIRSHILEKMASNDKEMEEDYQ